MAAITAQQKEKLASRMSKIKNVVLVLSGKGGVGKSSVSCQLALSLLANNPTATVGLLDIDLTGPSLPRMLGLQGKDVHQSSEGWLPVYLDARLRCMSIGFLLKNQKDSVVWRGPKKTAMIRQFLMDVRWGDLDWLIIDTPPGTSDEHISLLEQLKPMIDSATSTTTINAVLVTTPQAVSISDVSKELSFARKTSLPVLGLIENMSGYLCPHCNDITPIFGQGGGEAFCRIEEEKKAKGEGEGCRFLGQIPIDGEFVKLMDTAQDSDQGTLLERYQATPTFSIFKEISSKIVELIHPTSSSQNGTTERS